MATTTQKSGVKKAAAKKGAPKKKAAAKKAAPKKKSAAPKKNKLGVKNSLVNNINVKKKEGTSKTKQKSTVSKKAYKDMEEHWDKNK